MDSLCQGKAAFVANEDFTSLMLTRLHQDSEPHDFWEGVILVFSILAREAEKQEKQLPPISTKDFNDYMKDNPLKYFLEAYGLSSQSSPENMLEEATTDTQDFEEKTEYRLLSFKKFRPGNRDLMDRLEESYKDYMQKGKTGYQAFEWKLGTLYGYEFLQIQAEKERMKGLGL